jgi:hypothetical protein
MAENIAKLNFSGPVEQWKPQVGGFDNRELDTGIPHQGGWYDLDYLLDLLEQILKVTGDIYKECESILDDYALQIPTDDETFRAAHDQVYPSDTTPGIVTFDEYKYLLENNNSNAAQYVISAYEAKVRGSSGCNALDISLLVLYVNSECRRIKEFINDYIGEVDDSSEFRTIEIFQGWAEDAQAIVNELWKALKGKIKASIPGTELGELTGDKAREFQALFQVKLNVINKNIISDFSHLVKTWEKPSISFYNKNLGPALKFRLKVGRSITDSIDSSKFPTLFEEAIGTSTGLNNNLEVCLADCIKRNNMFFDIVGNILLNIGQRDSYNNYIKQLANIGKPVNNEFISAAGVDQASEVVQSRILDRNISVQSSSQTFQNLHSDLYGVDHPDAHPQYLLRTGNVDYPVVSDIYVEEGVKIDGVDLDLHDHDGVNSKKIKGSNIEYGSITTDLLDLSGTSTFKPSDLKVKTIQSNIFSAGVSKAEVTVTFNVDTTNVTGYEFEIIKLD